MTLLRRLIPCLDCRDGRVVKGVRFAGLREVGDPAELAHAYERDGADEIVLLDVSATQQGRHAALRSVAAVRAVLSIPLTVGGGVRGLDDAQALLGAGADKVAVNTAAVRDPSLLQRLAERFGAQCTVLALDARRRPDGGFELLVRSGTEGTGIDARDFAVEAVALGAGELLLTSHDRDGTRGGYELELIAEVARAVPVPVIASGGASGPEDMVAAFEAGADAVLAASIFHDGRHGVGEVKDALAAAGIEVRR